MPLSSQTPRVFRFGVFEVDAQEGELRKGGLRVKLQDQPFQVLVMLLERPGEMVSREELQRRLWPADTGYRRSHRRGENAQLFAQPRTLRIRHADSLNFSTAKSISPLRSLSHSAFDSELFS